MVLRPQVDTIRTTTPNTAEQMVQRQRVAMPKVAEKVAEDSAVLLVEKAAEDSAVLLLKAAAEDSAVLLLKAAAEDSAVLLAVVAAEAAVAKAPIK
jgi:hypothetical protein